MKTFLQHLWPWLLLGVLSFWTIRPLLLPGFFPIHDDTQVARVHSMASALREGIFPVRWISELGYGYGYPLFNFYAPLPYYIGGIFEVLGLDALVSTKLMFVIGILTGTFTMFILSRRFFGLWGGILSSILFSYAPYRALDIYVRGAVGEFWAMAFLPLVFLGFSDLLSSRVKHRRLTILLAAVSFAAIILSHNITGMLVVMVLVIVLGISAVLYIFKRVSSVSFLDFLLAFFLGLTLSAFFWLPAFFEKDYTSVNKLITGGSQYADHFIELDQLWDFPWGYGGSAPGRADGISFKMGKIQIVTAVLTLALFFFQRKQHKKYIYLIDILSIIALLSIFLSIAASKPIWDIVPIFAYIQFPWRFLLFTTCALTVLSGGLNLSFKKHQEVIVSSLSILTIFYSAKYFEPLMYVHKTASDYTAFQELQWRVSKISDEYLPETFVRPKSMESTRGNQLIQSYNIQLLSGKTLNNRLSVEIHATSQPELILPLAQFPGWKVTIDGKEAQIYEKNGKIALEIPKGTSYVEAVFTNTPIRTIGNLISTVGTFFLIVIYGKSKNFY